CFPGVSPSTSTTTFTPFSAAVNVAVPWILSWVAPAPYRCAIASLPASSAADDAYAGDCGADTAGAAADGFEEGSGLVVLVQPRTSPEAITAAAMCSLPMCSVRCIDGLPDKCLKR